MATINSTILIINKINKTLEINQSSIVTNEIGGINGIRKNVAENIHKHIRLACTQDEMPALNFNGYMMMINDNDAYDEYLTKTYLFVIQVNDACLKQKPQQQ